MNTGAVRPAWSSLRAKVAQWPWRKRLIASLVTAATWAIDKAFGSPIWNWLAVAVTKTIPEFGRTPIGPFGFALFVGLAIWFGISLATLVAAVWLESRQPKTVPAALVAPKPPVPTEEDLKKTADVIVLWKRFGFAAHHRLERLFEVATRETAKKQYLGELLTPVGNRLIDSGKSLSQALDREGQVHYLEVAEKFNSMYNFYVITCGWIGKMEAAKDIDFGSALVGEAFKAWHSLHLIFRDKMQDLVQSKTHEHTINTGVSLFAEDSLKQFMRRVDAPIHPTT